MAGAIDGHNVNVGVLACNKLSGSNQCVESANTKLPPSTMVGCAKQLSQCCCCCCHRSTSLHKMHAHVHTNSNTPVDHVISAVLSMKAALLLLPLLALTVLRRITCILNPPVDGIISAEHEGCLQLRHGLAARLAAQVQHTLNDVELFFIQGAA